MAELLELTDEPLHPLVGGASAIEIVGAELLVGDFLLEDVVGSNEDRVAQSAGCPAGAAAAAQALVLGAEVGGLAARGRLGRLGQSRM